MSLPAGGSRSPSCRIKPHQRIISVISALTTLAPVPIHSPQYQSQNCIITAFEYRLIGVALAALAASARPFSP